MTNKPDCLTKYLEKLFNRGFNHGLSKGLSDDGETYAVSDARTQIIELFDGVLDDFHLGALGDEIKKKWGNKHADIRDLEIKELKECEHKGCEDTDIIRACHTHINEDYPCIPCAALQAEIKAAKEHNKTLFDITVVQMAEIKELKDIIDELNLDGSA